MSAVTDDGNVAWFDKLPNEGQIGPEARRLLETYSRIPPEDVESHVLKIRDEAWNVFPYPCIGQFRFVDLSLNTTAEYPEILQRLSQGQQLLDMACCFGQEIRQLAADGAPSENIYGCDLRSEYISLGYKLFRDQDTLRTKFLLADIFDPTSQLADLSGHFDIIYTGSFFHLWGYEDQVKASKAVAALLRPEKGSMIVGRQVGSVDALEHEYGNGGTGKMYRHNVESLQKMWKEIGEDTGVSFRVDASLRPLSTSHLRFHSDDTKRIVFTIRRQ
ncbi:hypothetical protein K491DRAFT_596431 [Lophiostoma macrostomum CBS 122681]|uniref:Methyltransferase domain-containing protein n=1 Tax=Lophiostoma macrostomum CBS 122681 TaxID=1314788 RepID=A0A6A6TDN1_9PLEO|nr:hypothetical protein K491DRAFT_596431 [Lophiostoma macrostomum CBS 122681]